MNGYVYTTQAAAAALAPVVDASLGLPKAGVDVGGGIHVPLAQSVTTTYFKPIQNFANALQWAYVADGVVTPIVGPNAVPLNLPAPTTLLSTWWPTGP